MKQSAALFTLFLLLLLTLPGQNIHANTSLSYAGSHFLKPANTSFDLKGGIILVKAEIDGELANFILDTGSPMMIINEKVDEKSRHQANTLGGSVSGEWKKINQFSWGGVRKFNMKALSMDISHLEMITQTPIKGLIGFEFFGDFDLMLDFKNQIATLVPPDYVSSMANWKLTAELDFELEGHIPVINANIGDVQLRMGLDTGAGTNLLDLRRKKEIAPELLAPVNNASVIGLGGSSHIVAADVLETTVAGTNYWNMRYVFSDISSLKNLDENQVDGLLGYPFFQSGKFTINYNRRVISFWE